MIEIRTAPPEAFADPRHPFVATLVVGEVCNERCGHCFYTKPWARDPTYEELANRIEGLAARGVRFLALTGGEPSLRCDLEGLVAHATARGLRVALLTNGTKIDAERAARLVEAGLRAVSLTLFSAEAAEHEAITLLPGSFEKTLHAARAFRDAGVATTIRSPIMKPNRDALPGLVRLTRSERLGLEPYFELDPPRGMDRAPWQLPDAEIERILAEHADLFERQAHRFGFAEAVCDAEGFYHEGQCPTRPTGRLRLDGTLAPL